MVEASLTGAGVGRDRACGRDDLRVEPGGDFSAPGSPDASGPVSEYGRIDRPSGWSLSEDLN